jgi:hypothetical protein
MEGTIRNPGALLSVWEMRKYVVAQPSQVRMGRPSRAAEASATIEVSTLNSSSREAPC